MRPVRRPRRSVERLARDLAAVINAADGNERDEMREYAVALIRDATEGNQHMPAPGHETAPATSFSPFALSLLLALGGAMLLFLLPPVGLVLFIGAGLAALWGGVNLALFSTQPRRSATAHGGPHGQR